MMENENFSNWYFTKEQLSNSPSRKHGVTFDEELFLRQSVANMAQECGLLLKISTLGVNTSIVYMQRFYMFHSLTQFPIHTIIGAAVLLASKSIDDYRKLYHIKWALNRFVLKGCVTTEEEILDNENILLLTLGFDVTVELPHMHIGNYFNNLPKNSVNKDLASGAYTFATNSLHLTTLCLELHPKVVAAFSIYVASNSLNCKSPLQSESNPWFTYIEPSLKLEVLEKLMVDFLGVYKTCPDSLMQKVLRTNRGSFDLPSLVAAQRRSYPIISDGNKENMDKNVGRVDSSFTENKRTNATVGHLVYASRTSSKPSPMRRNDNRDSLSASKRFKFGPEVRQHEEGRNKQQKDHGSAPQSNRSFETTQAYRKPIPL